MGETLETWLARDVAGLTPESHAWGMLKDGHVNRARACLRRSGRKRNEPKVEQPVRSLRSRFHHWRSGDSTV